MMSPRWGRRSPSALTSMTSPLRRRTCSPVTWQLETDGSTTTRTFFAVVRMLIRRAVAEARPVAPAEPAAGPERLMVLRGVGACLAREARREQHDRVDRGEQHVELLGLGREQISRHRAQREVDREQAGEEHDLAAEPDDGADRNGVRPPDHRRRRRRGERSSGHAPILVTELGVRRTRRASVPRIARLAAWIAS